MDLSISELSKIKILLLIEAKNLLKSIHCCTNDEVKKIIKHDYLTYYGLYKKISKKLGV